MTIPSDCPITDAHAHFFGHGFFKALLSQRDTSGGSEALSDEMIARTEMEQWLKDARLTSMESHLLQLQKHQTLVLASS